MFCDDRKRVWIDQFQTRLVLRLAAYMALLPLVLLNLLFAWKVAVEGINNPPEQLLELLREYLRLGVCLLAVIPAMLWDAIRFSHRLVGPLIRFRRCAQDIARGEPVRPIKLRDGDYLTEFRDEFNEMLEALQRRGVPVLQPDAARTEDKVAQKA
jgi:hypothetical protein